MREHKYRAWDKEARYFNYAELSNKGFQIMKAPGVYGEWQQYTGLKDKNGKEIYEGDILRGSYKDASIGIVEWRDYKTGYVENKDISQGFMVKDENSRYGYENISVWLHVVGCDTEVIGSIYENPELIEKKT